MTAFSIVGIIVLAVSIIRLLSAFHLFQRIPYRERGVRTFQIWGSVFIIVGTSLLVLMLSHPRGGPSDGTDRDEPSAPELDL